ncbi:hypothetical protein [Chryseobacterium indoltheticum]|uniref:hypothetical protein n=1 Tax=Chryseobacterium indoltheticum TaxID=254 RepID=UPI003F496537
MNHYKDETHQLVSDKIKAINNIKWIVSYDNVPEINALYNDCNKKEFSFKHTAYKARIGKEVLFFSDTLITPDTDDWNPLKFKLSRKKIEGIFCILKKEIVNNHANKKDNHRKI